MTREKDASGIKDIYFSMFEGLSCGREIRIDLSVPLEMELMRNTIFLWRTGRCFFVKVQRDWLRWEVVLRASIFKTT